MLCRSRISQKLIYLASDYRITIIYFHWSAFNSDIRWYNFAIFFDLSAPIESLKLLWTLADFSIHSWTFSLLLSRFRTDIVHFTYHWMRSRSIHPLYWIWQFKKASTVVVWNHLECPCSKKVLMRNFRNFQISFLLSFLFNDGTLVPWATGNKHFYEWG